MSAYPLRDDKGTITQFIHVSRDITERKKAEEEIERRAENQSALNTLLQASLEDRTIEAILGESLDILSAVPWLALESKAAVFLVDEKDGALVMRAHRGMSAAQVRVCSRLAPGRCLCGRTAASGEIVFAAGVDERHEIRYEGIAPHGHYCVPIMSAEKKVLGVLNFYVRAGASRNEQEVEFLSLASTVLAGIIQRKRFEEKLHEANRQLREMDARKSDFVANVAHEFKNPLFIMQETTSMALSDPSMALESKPRHLIEMTNRNAGRLLRLVIDLLDLSKIEAGKMELNAEEVDLAALADEVMSMFQGEIAKKHLALTREIPPGIGMVWADKDKLIEVFVNLIGNAVKYTRHGAWISLTMYGTADEVRVEIVDTGEGIAKDDLEKIFNKFERVTAESQEGTGLGLPIAKDIIELHKGTIGVASEIGRGSTFFFVLPRDFRRTSARK